MYFCFCFSCNCFFCSHFSSMASTTFAGFCCYASISATVIQNGNCNDSYQSSINVYGLFLRLYGHQHDQIYLSALHNSIDHDLWDFSNFFSNAQFYLNSRVKNMSLRFLNMAQSWDLLISNFHWCHWDLVHSQLCLVTHNKNYFSDLSVFGVVLMLKTASQLLANNQDLSVLLHRTKGETQLFTWFSFPISFFSSNNDTTNSLWQMNSL